MLKRLSKTNARVKIVPELRRQYSKDWKELQQQFCYFDDIKADADLKRFINDHSNLAFDTEWAAPSLKSYADNCVGAGNDFFIITGLEFSKKSLSDIESIIHAKMAAATLGGYVSLLSYYLNWSDEKVDKTLPNLLSDSVDQWIKNFGYKVDNISKVSDYPMLQYDTFCYGLLEGKNFLFSHPNIRFWLWK